jgi:molybdopterin molybdotransferase
VTVEPAQPAQVPVLAWADARQAARAGASPLPAQLRPLDRCAGAVLAEGLRAGTPLPAFDVAAMDGFAVAGDGPWRVVGTVLAGSTWPSPLAPGTAVVISTGAPVPPGASAVLPVEDAELGGGLVRGAVEHGRHVRRAGEECGNGEVLLSAGTPVSAAVLGLAAASGHDALLVRPRPRVTALVTGDELLGRGLPRDGRVRDALGPQLPLLVAGLGGELVGQRHVRDEPGLLRAAVADADAEVLVTTGASSAGPADHLRQVVTDLGGQLLVDGVACRPGHPQLLATLPDGRFVVGLPGNPLAALVGAVTLLQPLLAGLTARVSRSAGALLAEPLAAAPVATRLVPVRLEGAWARAVPHVGPGMLRGAALADALAVLPPGLDRAEGDEVEVLPLP